MAIPETQPLTSHGSRAWELMYDVLRASKPFMEALGAAFELTPQQMFALRQLSNDRPLPMSALATTLGCDASNVTSIVDKLESRGFVERKSADHDRRVKALVMTASGEALQKRIEARLQEQAPPAIANLSPEDQLHLCEILGRALETL